VKEVGVSLDEENCISTQQYGSKIGTCPTDFSYLKVLDGGGQYLQDDYSWHIIAWRLCETMKSENLKNTLEQVIIRTGVKHINVYVAPGCFQIMGHASSRRRRKDYQNLHDMWQIRTRTYPPHNPG